MLDKINDFEKLLAFLKERKVYPNDINPSLEEINTATIYEKTSLYQLIKRPELNLGVLRIHDEQLDNFLNGIDKDSIHQAEIQSIYETYIEKEQKLVYKIEQLENHRLRDDFDYKEIKSLSAEATEKLNKIKPKTIGQASRISGVSPADISIILVYFGK